jgi:hypothetical protein
MQIEVPMPLTWKDQKIEDMSLEELRDVVAQMHEALIKSAEVSMRALKTLQEMKAEKPVIAVIQ